MKDKIFDFVDNKINPLIREREIFFRGSRVKELSLNFYLFSTDIYLIRKNAFISTLYSIEFSNRVVDHSGSEFLTRCEDKVFVEKFEILLKQLVLLIKIKNDSEDGVELDD